MQQYVTVKKIDDSQHETNTLEVANSTIMKKQKWPSVNGCESKSPI
jgi:hypothetical protein